MFSSTTRFLTTSVLVAATALVAACGQSALNSVAPTGSGGRGEAAADGSTLKVTAPTLVSPVGGVEVADLDPEVVFGRVSPLNVSATPLTFQYELEVFDEEGGRVYSRILGDGGDATTHELEQDLNFNELHTWRVRARLGDYVGPWSALASFKTFENKVAADSCAYLGNNPIGIVQCRRGQYDHIPEHELPEFLRAVAFDLNQAGVPGGPWGILQKDIGTNCSGYSCDIICSGQGNDQNQYDVLGDAEGDQIPGWSELEGIVERLCEIIE